MNEPSQEKQMAYYPIRIVSNETGVNAITLRAWERRYGLITPKRTAKGHRLYTEQDIQLIRKVVSLLNRGIPISQAQAMIENGETEDDLPTSVPARPSQWQHYREQLNNAVRDFDEDSMTALFNEVGQFFPVDVALRFLFLPLYRHLQDSATQQQGAARLRFYAAFLHSRLAHRLSEQTGQTGPSVLIANTSHDDDIELLLLSILLRQHGLRPVWLSGAMTPAQIAEVLPMPRWQALVINISSSADDQLLTQLEPLARNGGHPVFISGLAADQQHRLLSRGLIPLLNDLHQEALNIRDMLTGFNS
ncbi:MerR family transcriptional regulator [Thalassolituus sp. LLYu03]|uniref:MerR family transcriptional regulator n=1 Tax=Thalassolituus sp. LLYu03 TaxID=3421656 RepID=UPI003D2CB77B